MNESATRPDPLTQADCDLRDFAFMPLDVVRLRDSDLAATESGDVFRAAVLLWCASWHQVPAASLPDDDRVLANLAGYGRVVREWQKERPGALRGWVMCADGRLYHPVVAEKAREAWRSKLERQWKTECARIKKHNQRRNVELPLPDFEEWLSLGRPQGQPLDVPRDNADKSPGTTPDCPANVPRETASKGQGEGQGQGQGVLKEGLPSASLQVVGAQTGDAGAEPPQDPPDETDPEGAMPPGVPPCPHQAILALWAEVLPQLPRHRIWTKTRSDHLRARWRETAVQRSWAEQQQGLDYFRRLFGYVGKSRFLTGNAPPSRPGQPPFVCELEWLLLPSNWAKVIEGKYHQEAA